VLALAAVFASPLVGCAWLRKPAWELPPPPATDAPVVQDGRLHRETLANGLRLIVLEDHRLPRVLLGVAVRRGAGVVAHEQAGLASFSAELMERGAGARDALALARATDELGASLSAESDWDSVSVSVAGLSRDLPVLLEILADVVLRPRFDPAEARKLRGERLAGLERAKDDPATLARWNLMRALYDGHPYGRPSEGLPETLAKLEARDARDFHRQVFVASDAIFFAAGEVDMASLSPRVREAFAGWEPGTAAPPGPAPPAEVPPARRIVVVDRPDLVQAQIAMGHEGIARTDEQRIPAALMNTVLGGGGFASRLMERLRSEEGLTYSAGSGFSLRRHPGPFWVSTFTRVPEVRRTLDLALAELERMREHPPSETELRDAKALQVGQFSLGLETSSAVVSALVDLDVHGLPEDSLDSYRGRVRAVGVDDTARLARALLHPERVAIVVVGPAQDLAPQVQDLGPVEVVAP
jgi:zinc protease